MSAPLPVTPGQTVGPFFHYALPYDGGEELVPPGHPEAIRLHGQVFDGSGTPIPDALLEIWQADPTGQVVRQTGSLHRDGSTFTGLGRAPTDDSGHYSFCTLLPGATEPGRASFFAVSFFARGLLDGLFTRIYLPGAGTDTDPFLATVDPSRRDSLVAVPDPDGFAFDIHLQGERETVFLLHPGH